METKDWISLILPTSLALIAAIVGSYFSARFAIRKAFQERWWARKEAAYTEIIDALYDMIRYSDLCAEEYLTGRDSEHPKKKEFSDGYSAAHWRILRATDIGAFVISADTAKSLQRLRERPKLKWEDNPPWELYEEDSKNYRATLVEVRDCAKRDLNV